MDARSVEILQQLRLLIKENDSGTERRLLGELTVLNPTNRDVRRLKEMYQRIPTAHNLGNRAMWIEAMLR